MSIFLFSLRTLILTGVFFILLKPTCGQGVATDSLQSRTAPSRDSVELVIPTFLGNWQRNYYGDKAPDSLSVVWKHYLGKGETVISRKLGSRIWAGAGWTGQPLIVREDSSFFLIQGAYDHHLKKVRLQDGKLIWQYKFDDVVKGTGTIWDNENPDKPENRLVILQGSRLGVGNFLDSKHIPSYRAISYFTGEELWRLDVSWSHSYSRDVDASALILNDTVYIGLENSLFTLMNPDHRKARMKDNMLQPEIIQQSKLYTLSDVKKHRNNVVTESSPSLMGNHIYIASGSGRVWGYNLEEKMLDWQYYIGSDMDGSTIVTSDSMLLVSVEKQYIDGPGGVMKLNPQKGNEEAVNWYFPLPNHEFAGWEGGVIGSVGINDKYVEDDDSKLAAFVGVDGRLHVVEHQHVAENKKVFGPDSVQMFSTPVEVFNYYTGPSISTPVFSEDRLIVAGYHGIYLFAYNGSTNFKLLDKFPGSFEATPVFFKGKLYIASRNGYFYCLGSVK